MNRGTVTGADPRAVSVTGTAPDEREAGVTAVQVVALHDTLVAAREPKVI